MSLVVLHLVAAVEILIMEETVKALETKVAQLEVSLAKKGETASGSSSHSFASSSCALAPDHPLRINPKLSRPLREKTGWCGYGNLKTSLR